MSDTLSITGIQTDLSWENKAANLEMFEKKINSITQQTDIVILPEMFSTGFSMKPGLLAETMEGDTVQWMKRIAAEKKIVLAGSLIIKDFNYKDESPSGGGDSPSVRRERNGEAFTNRLLWMLPNGQSGYYDKRHLFANADEDKHYTPGKKRLVTSVKGWKILPLICYDLRFPVWSRQSPLPERERIKDIEYDVLIYVANWPERRVHAWKTLLQARAIENQCYVVGVNRVGKDGNDINHSGESMVIDPMGEVLYSKKDEENIFTVTLDKKHLENVRTKLPFWKDADDFRILAD